MISQALKNAAVPNNIKGYLINITVPERLQDSSNLGEVPLILHIKVDSKDSTYSSNGVIKVLGTRALLNKKSAGALPGDFERLIATWNEGYRPASTNWLQVLENAKVKVTVTVSSQRSTVYPETSLIATDLVYEFSDDFVNPNLVASNQPKPTAWPEEDVEPPFKPVKVKHPGLSAGTHTRIGYAVFDNPIMSVSQTRTSHVEQIPAMRLPGTIKKNTGHAYESYTISYIAQGPTEIKESVCDVLEHISLTPFTTVDGGPFGSPGSVDDADIPYKAIAIRNFAISTIEQMPNALQVEISFDPFNWEYYLHQSADEKYPIHSLDDAICWPLAKLWGRKKGKSSYIPKQFSGRFTLYLPNENLATALDEHVNYKPESQTEDLAALITFRDKLLLENANVPTKAIYSRNLKELNYYNQKNRTFFLKVKDKALFMDLIKDSNFVGLTDWQFLKANNYSVDGRLLTASTNVAPENFTRALATGNPFIGDEFTTQKAYTDSIVSVALNPNTTDIAGPITNYILAKKGLSSLPAVSDPNYARDTSDIQSATSNPQIYFAITLNVKPEAKEDLITKINKLIGETKRVSGYRYDEDPLTKFKAELLTSQAALQDPELFANTVVLDCGPGSVEPDIIVERIGGSRGFNLALMNLRGDPLPLHQYMGGIDATFVIEGKVFSLEAKRQLEEMKALFDQRAILKKSLKLNLDPGSLQGAKEANITFMLVDNEIFNLLGVNFVMPVSLSFNTIDQQPGVWTFTLSMIEYSPSLKRAEDIKFLPTTWDSVGRYYQYGWDHEKIKTNPIYDRAIEYFNIESELAKEEVYPDMSLPTIGEFNFWIHCILKGAKYWDPSGDFLSKSIFSEQERAIIREVIDFYPYYAQEMSKDGFFKDYHNQFISGIEPDAYVDPDFFVWYRPEETFGRMFDGITEHLMGPGPQKSSDNPKPSLAAKGNTNTDKGKIPAPQYREYNPNHGLIHSYPPEYWAANGTLYSIEAGMIRARDQDVYPKEVYNQVKSKVEAAEQKLDIEPDAWWRGILSKYTFSVIPSDKQGGKRIFTTAPNVEEDMVNGVASPTSIDPQIGGEEDFLNTIKTTGDLEKYYTIDWKTKMAYRVSSLTPSTPFNVDSLGRTNEKFYFKDELAIQSILNFQFESTSYDYYGIFQFESITYNIGEIEQFIEYYITNGPTGLSKNAVNNIKNSPYFLTRLLGWAGSDGSPDNRGILQKVFSTSWNNPNPWIERVAQINNYHRTLPVVNYGYDASKDTELGRIWNHAEKLSDVADPHVIRAFIIRRGGSVGKRASIEKGYADLVFPKGTTNADAFLSLCESYKLYLEKYKVPTIALLALQMKYTIIGQRDYYSKETGAFKEEVEKDLTNTASIVSQNRLSAQAIQAIRGLLQKYELLSEAIDQYYAGYISLGRVYGSYLNIGAYIDPFFTGDNRFIIEDTPTNEEIQVTRFTPSGREVSFSMSRGELDTYEALLKRYEGFNEEILSVEDQARMAKKMRSTLDPHSENAIYGSLVDFRTHAPFGKLRGAYPSFQILIINEGFFWAGGSKQLWDQFYTRTGIASIEVHKSRYQPGATASVTFSNMFHNISAYAVQEVIAHQMAIRAQEKVMNMALEPIRKLGTSEYRSAVGEIWNSLVVKNIPEDVRRLWMNNHVKRLALSQGSRLQIRMGYGSNASKLPVVFIGNVIEAPVQEGYVTIAAVSDGHELEKPATTHLTKINGGFAFADGGPFGTGADPSSIVKGSLISASWFDNLTGGNFIDHSNGIAHFGNLVIKGGLRQSTEIEFNIYSNRLTKIEQGISEIQRWNIVNGLVNWNNERNLFSVSVQEPTPWKVMEVCRRASADFVAAAEPFAMRSTVFFGKWWWPYHYAYDESILSISPELAIGNTGWTTDHIVNPIMGRRKASAAALKVVSKIAGNDVKTPYIYAFSKSDETGFFVLLQKTDDTFDLVRVAAANDNMPNARKLELKRQISDFNAAISIVGSWGYSYRAVKKASEYTAEDITNMKLYGMSAKDLIEYGISIKTTLSPGSTDEESNSELVSATVDNVDNIRFDDPSFNMVAPYDYLLDVKNFQAYLKWKPYMQAYIAHSGINLLDNNISADARRVFTDAIGIHQTNGVLSPESVSKTIVYSADTNIHPADRKTMMVDTGLYLTGTQAGAAGLSRDILQLPSRIPVVGGIIGTLTDPAANWIDESPTTMAIENGVVGALIDQVKEMYQGWFSISGIASVKPRDLFLFTDHILNMNGPVFVKDVIHRMDSQTGFVTLISPDAVVLPHDSIIGQQIITSLSVGSLHRIGKLYLAKGVISALFGGIRARGALREYRDLSKNLSRYAKLQMEYAEYLNPEFKPDPKAELPDIVQHEAQLDQEIEELRKTRAKGGLKGMGSDAEFEESIERYRNTRRANYISMMSKEELDALEGTFNKIKVTPEEFEKYSQAFREINEELADAINNKSDQAIIDALKMERSEIIRKAQILVDISEGEDRAIPELIGRFRNRARFGGRSIFAAQQELEDVVKFGQSRLMSEEVGFLRGFFGGAKRSLLYTPKALLVGSSELIKGTFEEFISTFRRYKDYTPSAKLGLFGRLAKAKNDLFGLDKEFIKRNLARGMAKEKVLELARAKKLKTLTRDAQKFLTDAYSTSRLLRYCTPTAVLQLIADVFMFTIGQSLMEGWNARMRARHAVKIIPLRVGDIPYTAGIKGHQGAVIGDEPSIVDEFFMALHGAGDALPQWQVDKLGLISGLFGLEYPDMGINEWESDYLEALKKSETALEEEYAKQ